MSFSSSQHDYVVPTEKDILAGRSSAAFSHAGNQHLREMVAGLLHNYSTACTRTRKSQLVNQVIKRITSTGGRFLKLESSSGKWYDAGMKEAKSRVSRTFRDSAVPNKVKCIERMSSDKEGPAKPQSCIVHPFAAKSGSLVPQCHIPTSFFNLLRNGEKVSRNSHEKKQPATLSCGDGLPLMIFHEISSIVSDKPLIDGFKDEDEAEAITEELLDHLLLQNDETALFAPQPTTRSEADVVDLLNLA